MFINFHDLMGIIGVSIIITAYFLLQIGKLYTENILFSILNIIGSTLILYSLYFNWNLASVVIECFWILISLIGVYKYFNKKNKG
jgi:hypothetical protein